MKKLAILFALGFLAVGTANATIIPVLLSGPTADGSNFDFNYAADLSGDERVDPAATNGITCSGPGGTLVQCNPPGTFFTLYDIPGFVSASVSSGWMVSVQNVGITPSNINGASIDNPSIVNVTFTYTGPIVHANGSTVIFSGFQIVSADGGINSNGDFSSQSTIDTGNSAGDTDQNSGSVTIPGGGTQPVPEPVSLILLGSGLLGVGTVARKKLRA